MRNILQLSCLNINIEENIFTLGSLSNDSVFISHSTEEKSFKGKLDNESTRSFVEDS